MRSLALLAMFTVGCAAHPRAAEGPSRSSQGSLRVTVRLAPDAPLTRRAAGRVGVAWLTPQEARDHREHRLGLRAAIDVLARFCVAGEVDLERGDAPTCALDLRPGEYVPLALLDARGEFIETWIGGGGDGNLLSVASEPVVVRAGAITPVTVQLRDVVHADGEEERCVGPRTSLLRVQAPAVAGRVRNPTARRLCVHVPPDYEANPSRRFPVLWSLPGLAGTDTSGFTRLVVRAANEAVGEGAPGAIVVGVDTRTRLGSSYLVDAPNNGAWASFITRDAIAAVDGAYRTRAEGAGRAVLGQSTGGFNAVSIAMRHPEVFSVLASSAPDALDFSGWFLDEGGQRARERWLGWMRLEDAVYGLGQWTSYAADWSHDPSTPRGFRWPVDLATGVPIAAVWSRWLAQTPAVMLEDPTRLAAVRAHLSGRIYLTAGRDDEADLFAPTERFSARLRALSVAHEFVPTAEGHFPTPTRVRAMVDFALRTLHATP